MIDLRTFAACNQTDLQLYYNELDNPLRCRICPSKNKEGQLYALVLSDGLTRWYVCPRCGFAGTGTEYLARVNDTEIGQLIQQVATKGIIPPVDAAGIKKLRQFKDAWNSFKEKFSRATPFRRNASIAFADMYDLDYYPPAKSFRHGEKIDFERCFKPGLEDKKRCTSSSRLFFGHWTKITAIPLYDLPCHLSGILFVSGHEQENPKCAIRRLGPVSGGQFLSDPGFLGTRALCRPDQTAIVLSTQWKLTLSLQAAIYRQEQKFPPLLAWFPANPRTGTPYVYSWVGLKNAPKVFWSTPKDIASLREACIQNSTVSYAFFDEEGRFAPPQKLYGGLLRSIIKTAEPWHKALTRYLEGDLEKIGERLDKINLPTGILDKYLEYAPERIRDQVVEKSSSVESAKWIDGDRILSNPEGWWKVGRGLHRTLLSNTRCSLEKIIHIVDEKPICQGKITIGGEEYPFTEKEEIFEKYPITTVKKVCVENSCPQFLRFNIKNDQYLRIVNEVSSPRIIHCYEGYGWSKNEAALLLPNVTISDTTVSDTALSLQTGPFHKLTFEQVQPIGEKHRQDIANFEEETPIVFALFSAVIPSLFSPAYRMQPPQTVIAGGDFMMVKEICEMLGVPQMLLKDKEDIDCYTRLHRCPFLVRFFPCKRRRASHEWADVVGLNTPAIIWTSITEAIARMSYGQANLVLLPGTRFYRWFDGKLPKIFLDCFMACLRHLSHLVLDPIFHTEDWNNDLIAETNRFFADEVGVAPAKILYGGYYDVTDYFYDYVNLLRRTETLVLEKGEKLSVTELAGCYRKHVGVFDFQHLYDELSKSKAVGKFDSKNNTLVLLAENLVKSQKRLEKFYGTLLRN